MAAPVAQVVGEYLSEAASSKLRAKHKLKKQVVAEEEERCWRGCGTGELAAQLRLRPEGLEVGGASLTSMRHSNWIFLRSWASLAAKSGCKAKGYQLPDLALKFFLQPSTEQKETGQVQTL